MAEPVPVVTKDTLAEATLALLRADEEFRTRSEEWKAYSAAYYGLRGEGTSGGALIEALLKTYGPRVATYFGGPAAAAGLTALTADPGAFAGLRSLFGKVLGLFGLGG